MVLYIHAAEKGGRADGQIDRQAVRQGLVWEIGMGMGNWNQIGKEGEERTRE